MPKMEPSYLERFKDNNTEQIISTVTTMRTIQIETKQQYFSYKMICITSSKIVTHFNISFYAYEWCNACLVNHIQDESCCGYANTTVAFEDLAVMHVRPVEYCATFIMSYAPYLFPSHTSTTNNTAAHAVSFDIQTIRRTAQMMCSFQSICCNCLQMHEFMHRCMIERLIAIVAAAASAVMI